MNLITAEEVRERLLVENLTEINNALLPVIQGAHTQFSMLWGSGLEVGTQTDVFQISTKMKPAMGGFIRLRLSHGLITQVQSVSVAWGYGLALAYSEIAEGGYLLDSERGYLLVPDIYDGHTLRVTYAHGVSGPEVTPEWVKEVLILLTICATATHPINQDNSNYASVVKDLRQTVTQFLEAHWRNHPGAVWAFHAEL